MVELLITMQPEIRQAYAGKHCHMCVMDWVCPLPHALIAARDPTPPVAQYLPTDDKWADLKKEKKNRGKSKTKLSRSFATVIPNDLQDEIKAAFDLMIKEVCVTPPPARHGCATLAPRSLHSTGMRTTPSWRPTRVPPPLCTRRGTR